MEIAGSGSIQTGPPGDGPADGCGLLGPHRVLQHGGRGGNLSMDNPCRVACSCRFSRMQPARPLSPSNLSTGTPFTLQTGTCRWSLGAAPIRNGRRVLTLCGRGCADLLHQHPGRRGPRYEHAHSSLSWLTGGTDLRSRGDREASFSKSSAAAAAGPLEKGARGSW